MAGINVNQLTSMLAKLQPDSALQNYARMHKNDPYIVSLAASESNRRKELRAAGQAMQGMQPQPKVVDVAIAQMAPQQLPEDVGIGQLSAQNLQFAAEGGIMGYEEPVKRMAKGGIDDLDPKELRERAEKRLRLEQLREGRLVPQGPYSPLPSQADIVRPSSSANSIRSVNPAGVAGYGLGLYHGDLNEGEAAELERRRAMGPTIDETFEQERARNMARVTNEGYTRGDPRALPTMPSGKEQLSGTEAPKVDTGSDSGGAGDAPSYAAPSMDISGMYRSAMDSARNIDNPFAADIEAVGKEKVKASEENLTGLEAIHKKFENLFKGRRDRLESRDAELGKLKEESLGWALLSAGAAMAKTPGRGLSGVLSGLTSGIDAGSKEYAKGMDKYRAAQEKLNDAKDRLEEIEAHRGEMSARELHKARNDIRVTTISAHEDLIKSNMDVYKLNREDAQKMFTAQVQYGIAQMEQGGANARAKLAASTQRLPAEANMAMMLGKGTTEAERLRSGLAEMAKFKGKDNTGGAELLKQYVELKKANPTLTTDEFLRDATNVMLPTYTAPPKNAVVRTQPGQ
jgi:hypothetical protein